MTACIRARFDTLHVHDETTQRVEANLEIAAVKLAGVSGKLDAIPRT